MKRMIVFISMCFVVAISCHTKKRLDPVKIVMPLNENAQIVFRSYLTDKDNQLLHTIQDVERRYIRSDSSQDRIVHFYIEQNHIVRFYHDKDGTLWNEAKLDLAALALNAGFSYDAPVPFSYFKPVYKSKLGRQWKIDADTVFTVKDTQGKIHELEYAYSGTARHDPDMNAIVPASPQKPILAQNTYWPSFQSKLYDRTSGEIVWQQKGEARELFTPEIGLVRSISNFTLTKKGESPVFRKSTFELKLLIVPDEKK